MQADVEHDADAVGALAERALAQRAGADLGGDRPGDVGLGGGVEGRRGGRAGAATAGASAAMPLRKSSPIRDARGAGASGGRTAGVSRA